MNATAPFSNGVASSVSPSQFESVFSSEKELLRLLGALRGATLDSQTKTNLRDFVLEYSATEDEVKRQQLKQAACLLMAENADVFKPFVASDRMVASAPEVKAPTKLVFGMVRPNPTFKKPLSTAAMAASEPTLTNETTVTPIPEVRKITVVSELDTDSKLKASEPIIVPDQAPVSIPVTPSRPEPAVTMPAHITNPQDRIGEIKRMVNSKVGNPINLIDLNKVVGTEYMNSLLDAMKKTSGSSPAGELDVAMARLEQAYLEVDKLTAGMPSTAAASGFSAPAATTKPIIVTPKKETVATVSTVRPAPTAESFLQSQIKQATLQKTDSIKTPTPTVSAVETTTSIPVSQIIPESPAKSQLREGLYHTGEEDVAEEPNPSLLHSLSTRLLSKDKEIKETVAVHADEIPTATSTIVAPTPSTTMEVKSAAEVSTLSEKMSALKQSVAESELAKKGPIKDTDAPEVTAGLERLLSEWVLFKSSGFLGTGPNGIDHPLYKRLSTLPMAAVVSGRFEGVTPEIKQSITDYMNGWRYEQGIVHEMGESFEHYLRRVILHIIEKQRNINR